MKKEQLPVGWEVKKLGDCFTLKSGEMMTAKMMKTGEYAVYGGNGISGLHNNFNLTGSNVIIGRVGALCGNVRHINEKIWLTDNAFQVVKYKYEFDNDFLTYLLNYKNLRNLARQTAQPVISNSSLNGLLLEFPKSLNEQKQIVKILDKTFDKIDQAKANVQKNIDNARELFQSDLNAVFAGKLFDGELTGAEGIEDVKKILKSLHPQNPDSDNEGWVEKMLQDVVGSSCTLSYGIVQPGEEYPNGLPIVRPTDLTSKFIQLSGLKLIDPRLAQSYKKTTLSGSELLLCVRGSTGVISFATEELKGANVTRGIVPISFNKEILNMSYSYYLFISDFVQKQIKAKTYGAALMQINIGDLRKIIVIFPPLTTQKIIVTRLNALSAETKKLEARYQQKLMQLEELRKSVLERAFKGCLNQDLQD